MMREIHVFGDWQALSEPQRIGLLHVIPGRQTEVFSFEYDINPDCYGIGLQLNISEIDNSQSLELAREVAAFFRLVQSQAEQIIEQVRDAVSRWRDEASNLNIPRHEQQTMESAFRFC